MGALASNHNKRDASSRSLPSGYDYNHHITKKLKALHSKDFKKVSRSSVSRLGFYPNNVTPIARETHAPCRFISGFLKRLFTYSSGIIRHKSVLSSKYSYAKSAAAVYNNNDNNNNNNKYYNDNVVEVIDLDKEGERGCSDVSVEAQQIVDKYAEMDRKGAVTDSEVGTGMSNGKMLESLSLNRGGDAVDGDVGSPFLKKEIRKIDELHKSSLRRLRVLVKLLEKERDLEQLPRPAKKKEDVENDPFRPLTKEEEDMVADALSYSNWNKNLVTHENSNIPITGAVLQCLRPHAWLNDEVINLYFELLKERENRQPGKFLKCHFFNTFFYKKLISGLNGYDYESVRRWTALKKLGYGLLECDKIFVPIHKEVHWCLAVINVKDQKFQYLDSHGGTDRKILRMLARYVTDEVKDKTGKNIDVTSWEQEFVTDLPNQENGYDCGMFMIKYADFYSRDIGLCFNQEHMPYFRLRTAKEILKLRAN